jgi:hypothetical protein
MEAPGALIAGLLDETGTICTDLACRRCAYNLRGLNPAGRCPECGTPVGLSCHGDLLRFADPGWLDTLARGTSFILWGVLVAILVGVGGGILAGALGTRALGTVLGIAGGLVGLYGAWLVTSPDPSGIGEDRYVSDRRFVRLALLAGVLSQVLQLVKYAVDIPQELEVALIGFYVAAALVSLVGEFVKLRYFQKLALRIPELGLASQAKTLRWAMAFSLGAVVLFSGIMALLAVATPGGPRAIGGPLMAVGCVVGIAAIAYFVVGVMILVLVYRLGKSFRLQAATARATWAEAGDPAGGSAPSYAPPG